jgi:protein-tyrosine phosphatase
VQNDRLVPLDGALNFRDLGGYSASEGRSVRWGLVYRSDALHQLSDADLETIRAIALRAVYDLRKTHERDRQPTVIPADHGHRAVHLVVGDDPAELVNQPDAIEQLLSGELGELDDAYMANLYREMIDEGAAAFGRLLTHLTDDDGLPAVFHCAAGKDRTGIAAALLLTVLGVDRETVLDDYELSNVYRANKRIEVLRPLFEERGVDIETVRAFLSARRPVLEATLAHVDEAYGSVEGYLTTAAGMSPATLERLREILLE